MKKSDKVYIISTIILLGFFAGVVIFYIMGMYMNLPFPFNTFLYTPDNHFGDFYETLPNAPLEAFSGVYFPLTYIFLAPLAMLKNKLLSYIIIAILFLIFHTIVNLKLLKCKDLTRIQNFQNFFIISYLAYPVLYVLDRGNCDMFLYIFLALAIYYFYNEKYLLSAIFFAIENAMKPFTILFIFLFLFKKKYKEFFLNILITLFFIFVGFVVLKGNAFDQVNIYLQQMIRFKIRRVYLLGATTSNASSLYSMLKFLLCEYNKILSVDILVKYYSYFIYLMSALTLFFVWKQKVFWKQIMFLTIYMCLVPYVVFDYKILFFFIPMLLFIISEEPSKFNKVYAVLFGLLMIPKQFFIGFCQHSLTTFGILINPIIMITFIVLLFIDSKKGDKVEKVG